MRASLDIVGLYNWDNTIFENLALPEGLEREPVVQNILLECAELEIIYPNAPFMKSAIGIWSNMEVDRWTKLYKTTQYEYNPIENYDRMEEWSDTGKHDTTNEQNATNTTTAKQTGQTMTNRTINAQNDIWGFNSTDAVPKDKNATSDVSTIVPNTENTATGTNTRNTTENGTTTGTHTGHIHGNIGVTTTQQLITEERKVNEFDIHHYIINDFKKRFCILVY